MRGRSGGGPSTAALDVAAAAQLACLLEAGAAKPGNVTPALAFSDTTYLDFVASAAAIGGPLGGAADRPVGETILSCVTATRRWARTNTNLGIILLLVPLARATAAARGKRIEPAVLRHSLSRILAATTVDDARAAYAAIRLVAPRGLGHVDDQDVAAEPTVTLIEAMRLAADRDDIAREYVTDFESTFGAGVPALTAARDAGLGWDEAVVETFLTLLAARPDTHIARRGGAALAAEVRRAAGVAIGVGGVRTPGGRDAVRLLDSSLRSRGNLANPGTTADVTAAAIFVVLLNGGWHSRNGGGDAGAR